MAERPRLLFVDDEAGIRITLPAVLSQFGFEVTAAADVPEALTLIATRQFEVLISDLNIGQPGDGFTVVSAMRRTQPEAATFILTGYPAFETALEAIRQQVDDYLVKPADIESLVGKINATLAAPKKNNAHRIEVKKLSDILDSSKSVIVGRWMSAAKQDVQISSTRLSDGELTGHLPALIEEIVSNSRTLKLSKGASNAAQTHGRARYSQGWTIPSLIRETRILHEVVSRLVEENLLTAEVSSLIPEIMAIGETMQAFLEESLRAYVHARHQPTETPIDQKRKSVLLVGADLELSLLRTHVLQRAGFSVTRADSRQEALQLLQQPFDALIISYSLPSEGLVDMTELFRERNKNSPIIAIAKGKWQDLKIDLDFVVTGAEGPEALLEVVETALSRTQLRRIR